ncbi:uncharacterized protein LOC117125538 [Anneissia japonica]|uniref:uncharacterized protein LOC117125538 n=1 Tax=Anneissia japonica TaxID=1529436 RepID=UPI0014255EBA|nr:uncharacterized protein LOC117125538 [Anneissia japonica]
MDDSSHSRRLLRFAGFVPIDQSNARISNRHADDELAFSLERLNIQKCKNVWEIKAKEIEAYQHLKRFERQKALARSLTSVDTSRIVFDFRRREIKMSMMINPERSGTESETENLQWKAENTFSPRKVRSSRSESSKTDDERFDSRTQSKLDSTDCTSDDTEALEGINAVLLRRKFCLRENKYTDDDGDGIRMGVRSLLYKRVLQAPVQHKVDFTEDLPSEFQLRNRECPNPCQIPRKERISWVKASVRLDTDLALSDQDEQSAERHTLRTIATNRSSSFRHLRKRPTMGKVRSKKELISLTHFDNILAATESEHKDKKDKQKQKIQRIRDDKLSARLQMFYHKVDDLEYEKSRKYCEDNLSSKSFVFYK